MRRISWLLGFLCLMCVPSLAQRQRATLWCEQGGQTVTVNGVVSSTKVQRSYVSGSTGCTVDVYAVGTTNHVTLCSDAACSSPGDKTNPFTATSAGFITFFVQTEPQTVDVRLSGAGISSPFTIPGMQLCALSTCASVGVVGYRTIQDQGTPLTQRTTINFTGTGVTCTDDSGTSTTICDIPLASGVTGTGTTGTFPIWSSSTTIGDGNLTNVTGPPAGVNYNLSGGKSWQIDASHITFNSGVTAGTSPSSVIIANTYAPAASNNAGGIQVKGAPATGSACAGSSQIIGGDTNGASNNSSISSDGACSNGFGAIGGTVTIRGGSTAASNTGGNISLIPGTGGFGNGVVAIGSSGAQAPMAMAAGGNRYVTVQAPAGLGSNWTFTWPTSGGTSGQFLTTNGSGVSSWSGLGTPGAIGGTTPSSGAFTTLSASGQITSTVSTGTAPLVIASTTPVANLTTVPLTYDASGTQQTATHIVRGRCTLGTDCAVTLSGSAVFTSSSSYDCGVADRTSAAAVKFDPTSGSAFTLTGTSTDALSYVCVGN